MKKIRDLLKHTKNFNLFGLILTTTIISILAVVDVIVIDKIAKINNSTQQIELISTIAVAMAIRSIANLIVLHFQSYFSFKAYQDLVAARYRDIVKKGNFYEKSNLVNYVGNESLQATLTVLMPSLALITSVIQIFILTAGTVYVSGYLLLEISLPIAILYALYIIPMQYILSKRGVERRAADELRSDYLNNAVRSLEELKFYGKSDNFERRYVLDSTEKINKGLTLKWANSEGQKSVLELCGIGGILIWYYAVIPGQNEIAAVSGLLFLFYRIAPLITRIAIAYQSLVYGSASIKLPYEIIRDKKFNAKLIEYDIIINNKNKIERINIKNNGLVLLIGPSGVGKSTLITEIADLIAETSLKIGFVGQVPLVLNGTLEYNLQVDIQEEKILIDNFGLRKLQEKNRILSSGNVSGGEAMRISLLRNYLIKPDILLLDEPFSALDSENKDKIAELLNAFSKTRPVICITHEIPTKLEVKNVIQLH